MSDRLIGVLERIAAALEQNNRLHEESNRLSELHLRQSGELAAQQYGLNRAYMGESLARDLMKLVDIAGGIEARNMTKDEVRRAATDSAEKSAAFERRYKWVKEETARKLDIENRRGSL